MSTVFEVGSSDIIGDRTQQQDSYIVTDPQGSDQDFHTLSQILVAVADGVGGEAAGDVASKTVTASFSQSIQRSYNNASDIPMLLYNGLHTANQAVHDAIAMNHQYSGMASTLVAAFVDNKKLYWVSVGDSHLYLLRDGSCIKLNADHSLGAMMDRNAESGLMSKEQAEASPNRNMIYSCVMGEELTTVDLPNTDFALQSGDRLIFASDGLNSISTEEINRIGNSHGIAQKCAEALTKAVQKTHMPNQDNAMVVVLDICVDLPKSHANDTKKSPIRLIMVLILLVFIGFALYYFLRPATDAPADNGASSPMRDIEKLDNKNNK